MLALAIQVASRSFRRHSILMSIELFFKFK
jgi:hypothetical protein